MKGNAFPWQDLFLSTTLFLTLGYLLVLGTNTGSVALIGLSCVFLLMFVGASIAEAGFDTGFYGKREFDLFPRQKTGNLLLSLSFLVGFAIMLLFFGQGLNVVSIYASATSGLDSFYSVFVTTVAAPVAEEFYFLAGGFVVANALMLALAGSVPGLAFLGNKQLRAVSISVLTALIFATYHTNNATLVGFFLAAVIFRAVLLLIATADAGWNVVPWLDATFLFTVGVHMANNINATLGFGAWVALMASNVVGWSILAFLLLNVWGVVQPLAVGKRIPGLKRVF